MTMSQKIFRKMQGLENHLQDPGRSPQAPEDVANLILRQNDWFREHVSAHFERVGIDPTRDNVRKVRDFLHERLTNLLRVPSTLRVFSINALNARNTSILMAIRRIRKTEKIASQLKPARSWKRFEGLDVQAGLPSHERDPDVCARLSQDLVDDDLWFRSVARRRFEDIRRTDTDAHLGPLREYLQPALESALLTSSRGDVKAYLKRLRDAKVTEYLQSILHL